MDMLDRRGVTIQPGDEVCFNAFQGVALRPLPDGWYEVAVGGVPAPVLPFEIEVVARWHPCRQGAGFSTLRLRPGDRVHMRDDPRMFVVLDAVAERGYPSVIPIGLADGGPLVPAVWEVEEKKLSLAEPYPVLEPYVDRRGNRLAEGDAVAIAFPFRSDGMEQYIIERLGADNRSWLRGAELGEAHKAEYQDLYGRPLALGDIVWRDGVQYRLATVAHGKLRPVDVFPVLDGDRGRPLRVVADRVADAKATWKKAVDYAHGLAAEALERQQASAPAPLDTWKSAAIGGTPFRINGSPRAEEFLITSAVVHPDGPRPSTLTEGEAGALAALGKLGLAVEWGMFLGVLERRWHRVHPRARLTWDVVGCRKADEETIFDEPAGVLVTFGMEGLDPIQRFLAFDDVQPAKRSFKASKKLSRRSVAHVHSVNGDDATGTTGDAAKPFRTLAAAHACPNARAFVVDGVRFAPLTAPVDPSKEADETPFVEFEAFAWHDALPPHLAASLIEPWTHGDGDVRGFVLGDPANSLRRVCAYQRAFDVIQSARRDFRADMARHYTPPKAETRPRSAIVDEFLGGIADDYFRHVDPDEDDV